MVGNQGHRKYLQHIGQDNLAEVGQTWRNGFFITGMEEKSVQRQADNNHLT